MGECHEKEDICGRPDGSRAVMERRIGGRRQSSGTAAEAKAMLDNAVVALKANEATALAAFNDKSNTKFAYRDLYVFCST